MASLAVLAAGAAAQAKRDTVRLVGGATESGTVKSEDASGVTLTLAGGKTATHPWSEVVDVDYASSPEFVKAISAFSQEGVAQAMPKLEALLADTKLRPVLRQHALYYHALGLQRTAKYTEALAEFDKLLKEFPTTRFLVGAAEGIAACHVANNDVSAGQAALDALASAASAKGVDPGTLGAVEVRKASLLEAAGKHSDAQSAYESAARRREMPAAQIAAARLGVARCKQKLGDVEAAERAFRELIADQASGRQVLAGAWNGVGQVAKDRGKTERNLDRLLEGLYAYLRGCVQYAPSAGEPTAEYERSVAGAAQCFKFISELEQDASRRTLFAQRAAERKALLERSFPNSVFLKEL
jgi:tetratricopeptide (TPR) repeat protein